MGKPAGDFPGVFDALRAVLAPWQSPLQVVSDTTDNYHLDTHHIMQNKKPLFFGAVQLRKRYVSYHLMPVYVNPELLVDISDELRARMQGKSCFNFRQIDQALFDELAALTGQGFQYYVQAGYIEERT